MRFAFLLALSAIAFASLVFAASFPPDAVVILVGTQVDKQITGASEGRPLPAPSAALTPSGQTTVSPTSVQPAQVSQLGRALSQLCAPNLAERIVKYSNEAVASARKKGSPAPSAEELAIMSAAMVMTEHQARRGEGLGVCGDSSTRLSPTNDCGTFQISMNGGSIYGGKRRSVYNANSDRNSADYALSCFNPDNNVREGVYAVLGAWQAYRRNPSAYSSRAGGPAELGNVGLIYNKGAGGAKGGGDPNNYYARFIANYNHVKKLAG